MKQKKEVADDDKILNVIGTFVVWLIREKTKIIPGYIESVDEKAVVAYYENFTKTNPSSWTYNEV